MDPFQLPSECANYPYCWCFAFLLWLKPQQELYKALQGFAINTGGALFRDAHPTSSDIIRHHPTSSDIIPNWCFFRVKTVKAYVDFVNNVVIEGFVSTIAVSLQYLCEILDPLIIARHEMLPLFEAQPKSRGQNWMNLVLVDQELKNSSNGCRFRRGYCGFSTLAVTAEDVKIELQGTEIVFDPPFEERVFDAVD